AWFVRDRLRRVGGIGRRGNRRIGRVKAQTGLQVTYDPFKLDNGPSQSLTARTTTVGHSRSITNCPRRGCARLVRLNGYFEENKGDIRPLERFARGWHTGVGCVESALSRWFTTRFLV